MKNIVLETADRKKKKNRIPVTLDDPQTSLSPHLRGHFFQEIQQKVLQMPKLYSSSKVLFWGRHFCLFFIIIVILGHAVAIRIVVEQL